MTKLNTFKPIIRQDLTIFVMCRIFFKKKFRVIAVNLYFLCICSKISFPHSSVCFTKMTSKSSRFLSLELNTWSLEQAHPHGCTISILSMCRVVRQFVGEIRCDTRMWRKRGYTVQIKKLLEVQGSSIFLYSSPA